MMPKLLKRGQSFLKVPSLKKCLVMKLADLRETGSDVNNAGVGGTGC